MALITGLVAGIAGLQASAQKNHPDGPLNHQGKYQEIIIQKNGDLPKNMDIKIEDGNITINGKTLSDPLNGDITVIRKSLASTAVPTRKFPNDLMAPGGGIPWDAPAFAGFSGHPNSALLGVYTLKSAKKGVLVKKVALGSAAEKAGIQAGDLITQVDQVPIADPQDLVKIIGSHQPGDQISITYFREGKKFNTQAQLKKNEESLGFFQDQNQFGPGGNFTPAIPGRDMFRNFIPPSPRLGLRIQDTKKGNGATILSVTPGSPASHAGLKKEDVIQEVGGRQVNNAGDVAQALQHQEGKPDISLEILRQGQTRTMLIRVPQELNTLNL